MLENVRGMLLSWDCFGFFVISLFVEENRCEFADSEDCVLKG